MKIEIKDGGTFSVGCGGLTYQCSTYTDMEGDPPWPLVTDITCNGEEVWPCFDNEDTEEAFNVSTSKGDAYWTEQLIKAHALRHGDPHTASTLIPVEEKGP